MKVLIILLWVLLALVGVLALIAVSRLGVSVRYTKNNPQVFLHLGFVKINTAFFSKKQAKADKIKKRSLKKDLKKALRTQQSQNTQKTAPIPSKSTERNINSLPKEESAETNINNTSDRKKESVNSEHSDTSSGKKTHPLRKEQDKETKNISFISRFIKKAKSAGISELIQLIVQTLTDISPHFSESAQIKISRFRITVSNIDADKTALNYGVFCIAHQNLNYICSLYSIFKNNDKASGVYFDFDSGKTKAELDIKFSLRVYSLIKILITLYKSANTFKSTHSKEATTL